jgi:hypothetical protein
MVLGSTQPEKSKILKNNPFLRLRPILGLDGYADCALAPVEILKIGRAAASVTYIVQAWRIAPRRLKNFPP